MAGSESLVGEVTASCALFWIEVGSSLLCSGVFEAIAWRPPPSKDEVVAAPSPPVDPSLDDPPPLTTSPATDVAPEDPFKVVAVDALLPLERVDPAAPPVAPFPSLDEFPPPTNSFSPSAPPSFFNPTPKPTPSTRASSPKRIAAKIHLFLFLLALSSTSSSLARFSCSSFSAHRLGTTVSPLYGLV